MTELKKNIDHYMQLKRIKKYSNLLYAIALQLGLKGDDAYSFARREKSNFSKMLNGSRPLKYEYIIPLEKIFGVSLARIMEEDSYKLHVDKKLVPYLKGFRYYAYLDDMALYENELYKLLSDEGRSILCNTDEFGKTFLDYVIEYNAVNGVRFLSKKFHLKLKMWNNQFETVPFGIFFLHNRGLELARMVANMNDVDLFNEIYDPYFMFVASGYYLPDSIFTQDEYFEIVLEHDDLFDSIFKTKEYFYKFGKKGQQMHGIDGITILSANPIMSGCLKYACNHIDKYKKQAIKMLEFGIEHNNEVVKTKSHSGYLYTNEIGGVLNSKGFVCDLVILKPKLTNDVEVDRLINLFPEY